MPHVSYFWDEIEDNVIEEYDENGNTIANYTTEPTLYGSVLSQDRGGEKRYFQFDGEGNTTDLTDETGVVTDTRRYSGFAEVTAISGITVFPWKYSGSHGITTLEGDDLSYFRRRWYSCTSGRFLTLDPMLDGIQHSHFAFVGSNPINSMDPSGMVAVAVTTQWCTVASCGAAHTCQFVFSVPLPIPCKSGKGYIVQRVVKMCATQLCKKTCDGKWECPDSIPGTNATRIEFWERFEIDSSGTAIDQSNFFVANGDCGRQASVGWVRFFCNEDVSCDGWKKDQVYKKGPRCEARTGRLLSTDKPPEFWEANSTKVKSSKRRHFVEFDCCHFDDESQNTIDPEVDPRL